MARIPNAPSTIDSEPVTPVLKPASAPLTSRAEPAPTRPTGSREPVPQGSEKQKTTINPPAEQFSKQRQEMRQSEVRTNAEADRLIELRGFDEYTLARFLIDEYNRDSLRMKNAGKEVSGRDEGLLALGQLLEARITEIGNKAENKPKLEKLAKEKKRVAEHNTRVTQLKRQMTKAGLDTTLGLREQQVDHRFYDLYQGIFYDVKELQTVLTSLEDEVLDTTVGLGYTLQEKGKYLPATKLGKELSVRGKQPEPPIELSVRGKQPEPLKEFRTLWDFLIKPLDEEHEGLTTQLVSLSPAWKSDRYKLTKEGESSPDVEKKIRRYQRLRYSIYESYGLNLDEVDQLGLLGIDPKAFSKKTSMIFHNDVLLELTNILTAEHGVNSILDLDDVKIIDVLQKARLQAAEKNLGAVGKAVVAEQENSKQQENNDIRDLKQKAADKKTGKKGTPEEIAIATENLTSAQNELQTFDANITRLRQLDAPSGTDSIDEATVDETDLQAKYNDRTAKYESLRDDHQVQIQTIDQQSQQTQTNINQIIQEVQGGQLAPEDLQQKQQEYAAHNAVLKALAERRLKHQEKYEHYHGLISEAEEAYNTARRKKTKLETEKKKIITKVGQDEQTQKTNRDRLTNNARTSLKEKDNLVNGNPSEADKTYGEAADKLHSIMTQDFNTIIDLVFSGKVTLAELSGFNEQLKTYDVQAGYDGLLKLLLHTGGTTLERALEEGMFSQFSIAYEVAKFYGVEFTGDLRIAFNDLNAKRTEVREGIKHGHKMEAQQREYRNLEDEHGKKLLEGVLPQIQTHGRAQAAQLIQHILHSKLTDALADTLLDPPRYASDKSRPVEPLPPPLPEKPGGERVPKEPELENQTTALATQKDLPTPPAPIAAQPPPQPAEPAPVTSTEAKTEPDLYEQAATAIRNSGNFESGLSAPAVSSLLKEVLVSLITDPNSQVKNIDLVGNPQLKNDMGTVNLKIDSPQIGTFTATLTLGNSSEREHEIILTNVTNDNKLATGIINQRLTSMVGDVYQRLSRHITQQLQAKGILVEGVSLRFKGDYLSISLNGSTLPKT